MMKQRTASRNLANDGAHVEAEQIAHVFRRCGFGPWPGDVERWQGEGAGALIDALLSDDTVYALDEDNLFDSLGDPGEIDGDDLFNILFDQMLTGENRLHERMTWYWHTHLTSSAESSAPRFAWRQHHLLRRHALGNFRDLARAISTDPAMLFYLDGAGSYGENPNENYAREFLELFTLGRTGGYTEDDVRAAARIFSGWHVDWDTGEVEFDPDTHYDRPVTFMTRRQRWTIDSFIDFVCEMPACHRHVVTRLYHHLVGPDLSDTRRDQLAKVFADHDLEIKPLVEAMLRGSDFLAATHSRVGQPIEWVLRTLNALGITSSEQIELKYWHLESLGQVPLLPPNVAGWPLDDRWASTSQIITRTGLLLDWELPEPIINSVEPAVDAVLARCGIYAPSASTRAALDRIEADFSEFDYRLELLFVTTMTSPEFTLL